MRYIFKNEFQSVFKSKKTHYSFSKLVLFLPLITLIEINCNKNDIISEDIKETVFVTKKDAYLYARILYVVILIESKSDDLLYHELRSLIKYIKDENKMFVFENVFIKFFQKILSQPSMNINKKLYSDLHNDLDKLKATPFEYNALIYFDFSTWAKNKF